MKQLTGILFLIALAGPLILPVCFHIRQHQLRREAKEKLQGAHLQTFSLKKNELVWVKKNKELLIRGHLFDVKEIQEQNDLFVVTGLFDEKEDLLYAQLEDWQQQPDQSEMEWLSGLLLQVLYAESLNTDYTPFTNLSSTAFSGFHPPRLHSPWIELLSPPPDC